MDASYSLVASCKLCQIDPLAYLRDVLERIRTTPASRIPELLPRDWKPAHSRAPHLRRPLPSQQTGCPASHALYSAGRLKQSRGAPLGDPLLFAIRIRTDYFGLFGSGAGAGAGAAAGFAAGAAAG